MFLKKIGFNGAERIKLSINLEALAMIRDSEYFFFLIFAQKFKDLIFKHIVTVDNNKKLDTDME